MTMGSRHVVPTRFQGPISLGSRRDSLLPTTQKTMFVPGQSQLGMLKLGCKVSKSEEQAAV